MSRRTTIVDIAKKAELSVASVSQALRARPDSNIDLSPDTVRGLYVHSPDGYLAGVHDAAEENGIRVPDDISLVGYNGDYGSVSAWQDLTIMRIPAYQMGRDAFDLAFRLIEGNEPKPLPSLDFQPELIVGNTVCASRPESSENPRCN